MPGLLLRFNLAGKIQEVCLIAGNDLEQRLCDQLLNEIVKIDMGAISRNSKDQS